MLTAGLALGVLSGCDTTSTQSVLSNAPTMPFRHGYGNVKVAGPLLWIGSNAIQGIEGFDLSSNGDVPPSALIFGSRVPSVQGSAVSTGPNGELYVPVGGNTDASIYEYSRDSSGNVSPRAIISCGGIGQAVASLAVGAFGKLVVANSVPMNITIIPAFSNGCVTNNTVIQGSNLEAPLSVAVLPNGDIVVADNGLSIKVFNRNASGNATPVRVLEGPDTKLNSPEAVATDAIGDIYAANDSNNSVTVYRPGANGDARPIERIVGPHTALYDPQGIAVSSDGRIFVSNVIADSIVVFAPGSSGDAAPIQVISGAETGLRFPGEISVSAR